MPVILAYQAIAHAHSADPAPIGAAINSNDADSSAKVRSSVVYLRFRSLVRLRYLELRLSQNVGRWVPKVPSHPAHVVVSRLDHTTCRWLPIADVELPADERISGKELDQSMSVHAMDEQFAAVVAETVHRIDLPDLEVRVLRVECDREHPTWPSHGECNGGPFNVPFAILQPLTVWGLECPDAPEMATPTLLGHAGAVAQRLPLLTIQRCAPKAPDGMRVRDLPQMILFESPRLAIGFSLRRPLLMHLGWDSFATSVGADFTSPRNRLVARRKASGQVGGLLGGLSGPVLRPLDTDRNAQLWGGTVTVEDNRVCYNVNPEPITYYDDAGTSHTANLRLFVQFEVWPDGFELSIDQELDVDLPVLEAEAWRFAWDMTCGMTAPATVALEQPGRTGQLATPVWFAAEGHGVLCCRDISGDKPDIGPGAGLDTTSPSGTGCYLQTESYNSSQSRADGFVLADRPTRDAVLVLPAGRRSRRYRFSLNAFTPQTTQSIVGLPGYLRHWGSVFSCFRSEFGGFSNHAVSTNCHVNQWAPVEVCAYTARSASNAGGSYPLDMARFTIGRALLGGGGYGYHRSLYLDSDPILVSMAGRIHQADPDLSWLKTIHPGLIEAYQRIIATIGNESLALCQALSGNRRSYRWSSNAMDVVGFGHIDAYVNAWTYRGLRNLAALFAQLHDDLRHDRALAAASRLQAAYASALVSPETGWVAGWRSSDGQLHDYAFTWVNAVACAFGLLDQPSAKKAMTGLEALRDSVGLADARLGLPANLMPIHPGDHMGHVFTPAGQPSFELYTDGGMSAPSGYYLRALSRSGLQERADHLARDLDEGYSKSVFSGAMGEGQEFLTWEGLPTGYEGTLINRLDAVYAIALQFGTIRPFEPEWWPAIN